MKAFIRKLQSKPVEVRQQMLVGSLVVAMTFVGAVWIYGLTYRFGEKNEEVVQAEKPESESPFKLFQNSLSGAYSSISASVSNISKSDDEIESEPKPAPTQIEMVPVERNYTQ